MYIYGVPPVAANLSLNEVGRGLAYPDILLPQYLLQVLENVIDELGEFLLGHLGANIDVARLPFFP